MKTVIPFVKMVAAGNDFLLVDVLHHALQPLARRWPAVSRALCDRHQGIGADGLLVLERSRKASVRMRVFNSDGSEAQMCGNGARCVARLVSEWPARRRGLRISSPEVTIETAAGTLSAVVAKGRIRMRWPDPTDVRLDMTLTVNGEQLNAACVNTGVPHAVVSVSALETVDVNRVGRLLRHHEAFGPRGTNVDFIQTEARDPSRLRVRTYERGVEGETLACGTGVVASAAIHALQQDAAARQQRHANGRTRAYHVDVETRSGEVMTVALTVVAEGDGRRVRELTLDGTARHICDGVAQWPQR